MARTRNTSISIPTDLLTKLDVAVTKHKMLGEDVSRSMIIAELVRRQIDAYIEDLDKRIRDELMKSIDDPEKKVLMKILYEW